MHLKKIISLCLLTLSTLFITSCYNDNNKTSVSLNIWTYYNGSIETSFQKMIQEFNSTQGAKEKISVSSISQGSQVNDLSEALISAANEETGADVMPDLFISYADCAYEINSLGKLANIDDYFSEKELSNFNDDFLTEGTFDDHLKILPVSKSTEALYINKTDFDKFLNAYPEYNITYSDFDTFEGIIKISKAYYEKTGKAFFGRDSLDNYFVVGSKVLGIDVLQYDENNNFGINFNHDTFKKLWDSYFVPSVYGYFNQVGKFRSSDVQVGTILAYIGSTASASYFPKEVIIDENTKYPIELLIKPMPNFEGKARVAVSQGAGFCITKSTKAKEKASATFLKWLCETENISTFSKTSSYFPSTKNGFTNTFIDGLTDEVSKMNFTVCKYTIENYQMYTNVVGLNGSTYRTYLKTSLQDAINNAKTVLKNSTNKEETISTLTSDSYFEQWFSKLKSGVSTLAL